MVRFPGEYSFIDASIWSGECRLPEYDDESLDNSELIVSKYIECTPGQTFKIRYQYSGSIGNPLKLAVSCQSIVDGKTCDSSFLANERFRTAPFVVEGAQVNDTVARTFVFADLMIDENSRTQPGIVFQRGCIELQVHYSKKLADVHDRVWPQDMQLATNQVSEKSLKGQALSCAVQFGGTIHIKKSSGVTTRQIGPVGTVRLLYRTKDDLKRMLVIPRSPKPRPLCERDVLELSADELRAMQAELRELRETKTSVKRELEDDAVLPLQTKRAKASPIIVIDDSDDSDDVGHAASKKVTPRPSGTKEANPVEVVDIDDDGREI